jgi:hypothetical protein
MKFGELVGTVHDNCCQPFADPLPEDDGQHEAAAALSGGAEALLTAVEAEAMGPITLPSRRLVLRHERSATEQQQQSDDPRGHVAEREQVGQRLDAFHDWWQTHGHTATLRLTSSADAAAAAAGSEAVGAGYAGLAETAAATAAAAPGGALGLAAVSHSCACIGSPCLRHCVHGAPIGTR